MNKKILTFALAVATASAGTITAVCNPCLVGFEDNQTVTSDNDFNDVTATINGTSMIEVNGVFSLLTPALALSNNHNPFWNNVSYDGLHMNIGDYWEGVGGFSGGPISGISYLAMANGSIVSQVEFSSASNVTIAITGGITSYTDTLDVCYVSNCSATLQTVGTGLTWAPSQTWEIVGVVNGSILSHSDSGQSSFAFAIESSAVPEPGAAALLAIGLAGVMFGRSRHWRQSN